MLSIFLFIASNAGLFSSNFLSFFFICSSYLLQYFSFHVGPGCFPFQSFTMLSILLSLSL
jgi:hypothetical protein